MMDNYKNKIKYMSDLKIKKIDQDVVCYGHFNLLHPGHIRFLQFCKKKGSSLTILLISDSELNKNGHNDFFPELDRAMGLASLGIVDRVIISEDNNISSTLNLLKPKFFVLGKEFENSTDIQIINASNKMRELGGDVIFHSGDTNYYKSELTNNYNELSIDNNINLFKEACKRQKIVLSDLAKKTLSFKNANLLVIGDTIIDQYIACDALGMSAEAPIVVYRELETKEFLGGAAIVALQIRTLGGQCHYISILGNDDNANYAISKLNEEKIYHKLISDDSRPTTFKMRYMVQHQKVCRVSRLAEHNLSKKIENKVISSIIDIAPKVRGILVSDFVYGLITPKILDTIVSEAKKNNISLFGDLQCSSQVGNVTKFEGFDLICPTEREARISLNNKDDGIEQLAYQLIKKTSSKNILMKLGASGFIAYSKNKNGKLTREHFPALSKNPVDVTGAGDSLIASLSLALSAGFNFMESCAIGASIASLAVETVGNKPVSKERLDTFLEKIK